MSERIGTINRETRETSIQLKLNLDGTGIGHIITGVGFFDHMLDQLCKHGLLDLDIEAKGDLHIDAHHLVEDTGISLGKAFADAIGDKAGIRRYGWAAVPLDEALALVSMDISGRGMLTAELGSMESRVGDFDTELVAEFLRAFASSAGITLHVRVLTGVNTHHIIEATFKALARAIREAVAFDPRQAGVPSTKGTLQG